MDGEQKGTAAGCSRELSKVDAHTGPTAAGDSHKPELRLSKKVYYKEFEKKKKKKEFLQRNT